jgi:hypothetical protein
LNVRWTRTTVFKRHWARHLQQDLRYSHVAPQRYRRQFVIVALPRRIAYESKHQDGVHDVMPRNANEHTKLIAHVLVAWPSDGFQADQRTLTSPLACLHHLNALHLPITCCTII